MNSFSLIFPVPLGSHSYMSAYISASVTTNSKYVGSIAFKSLDVMQVLSLLSKSLKQSLASSSLPPLFHLYETAKRTQSNSICVLLFGSPHSPFFNSSSTSFLLILLKPKLWSMFLKWLIEMNPESSLSQNLKASVKSERISPGSWYQFNLLFSTILFE